VKPRRTLEPVEPKPSRLADQDARDLIANDLDSTLVVEAAAGTGKTTALVGRILRVIEAGGERDTIDRIVAVTFTEKAAGELKLRLRETLEEARARSQSRDRLDAALARLEEAHIGTIHAFCADLLRERPVEARVDPLFTVLTEPQADRLYAEAFHAWLQEQLADPPEGVRRALRRSSYAGFRGGANLPAAAEGPIDRLRSAGRALVEWRDFPHPWTRDDSFDRAREIEKLVDELNRFAELTENPSYARDFLYLDTAPARTTSAEIKRALGPQAPDPRPPTPGPKPQAPSPRPQAPASFDEIESRLIDLARDRQFQKARHGRGPDYRRGVLRASVVAALDALKVSLDQFRVAADADLAALLQQELQGSIDRYERLKAQNGALDFLDLLIKTRDLVNGNAEVLRAFRDRFSRIFVDEFQDTDPLQAEILLKLSGRPGPGGRGPGDGFPEIEPGKLFIVGDPKQSIYRFRRADVAVYRRVCEDLIAQGAKAVMLTTSFRSTPQIQAVVNAAFAPEMTGDEATLQAGYVPLSPFRPQPTDRPSVVVLPVPEPYGSRNLSAVAMEKSLPDAVGAFIEWLIGKSGWGIQPRDVCILFRRFLSFGDDVTRPYVDALEARSIPHVLVGGKTFHGREEVESIRAALAAVEWPDDELSVFATLRGALFAIGDEDLLEWHHLYRGFHPFRVPQEFLDLVPGVGDPPSRPEAIDPAASARQAGSGVGGRGPEAGDRRPEAGGQGPGPGSEAPRHLAPIADALLLLQRLHRRRNYRLVSDTIGDLLDATRAHVGFVLRAGGEQALANVLHLAELARRYELEGGISFRGFVEALNEAAEGAESAEAPILEEGSEGVRLMTVHKAKGLEFPVVILADLTCKLSRADAGRWIDPERRLCALRLGGWAPHDLLQQGSIEVAREQAEAVRLTYVAATRAKDLLVVPAVGDEAYEGGWVDPLNKAIYPPAATRREPRKAPGCPAFVSKDSVLTRPGADPARPTTVAPGLHEFPQAPTPTAPKQPDPEHSAAKAGPRPQALKVVWWDPRALDLNAETTLGLRRDDLIVKDVDMFTVDQKMHEYERWRASRDEAIASGARPTLSVRTVTEIAQSLEALEGPLRPVTASPALEIVDVSKIDGHVDRPSGPRFGTLVHAVLSLVPLDAPPETIRALAETQARIIGATTEEIAAAIASVTAVLAHPLLQRAREAEQRGKLRRELPVAAVSGDTLVEGAVDLFIDDEEGLVIDFKTDRDPELDFGQYERQVAFYCEALGRLRTSPPRGVLMRI
jgi:ATP-dependent helicase/nuclease subunit A